jgi:hypothetical protein
VTAAGHATLLTGAYPHRTGIIGNEWRDSQTGQSEYCTGDPSETYIGHPTRPLDGTSPRNLKAETVGDVLRRANPQSKVISISGKDRGAILPAGKAGTAYMYMSSTGQFASSTYYMPKHPAWVDAFNAARPADRYFRMEWKALLPEAAYAQSVPDKQPWFGLAGGSLPARFSAPDDLEPGPNFYGSLLRGPFADALTLDFARSAMEGEQLGQDAVPDILSVSLSGHDYVNHAFSAESRLSHDHMLQLDRMLQDFWRDLDAKVGKDHYVAVLTADHGFMPALEYSAQQGLPTGRVDSAQMLAHVSQGLESRLGPGKWVMGFFGIIVVAEPGFDSAKRPGRQRRGGCGTHFAAGRTRYRCGLHPGRTAGQPPCCSTPVYPHAKRVALRCVRRCAIRTQTQLEVRPALERHDPRLPSPVRYPRTHHALWPGLDRERSD